ncbi:cysteine desulfurase-like protein [Pseudochrobactrum asaccharolyticum]|uniref:Cysteine desulfurase family protein (TIGR01976 family) n=1 Tax=Pseudochrobactrum asaccharolyticum TaxID=354351 RepID=A0A366E039_9HYPH|nr:cysteine desulfurase-like protein [Pseudochrobactrum asaccharolyticum]RBO95731.1 cysteine desulfurase family protein (TIGR01976 family) [Pseudochrobactrum asaccharolyticum]
MKHVGSNTIFPVLDVRSRFPALSREITPPVYLDNPAGTLVPRMVIDEVAEAMASASSNLGGAFAASKRADTIWQRAHEAAADLLGASSMREIVIGQNMTTLTLHLSRSIGRTLKAGDEIIVTQMDHEGDVAPWLLLAQDLGLTVKWLPFSRDSWRIEPEALQNLISDRTRLVALNFASNMTGSVNDIAALSAIAKAAGALVYVDAVQLLPHRLPNVQALGCDFLACSSYKFFGPHLGIVWGREELLASLEPYKCRCASDALPERFETGTPQTELLAGFIGTVNYLEWLGEATGHSGTRQEKLQGAYTSFDAYEMELTKLLISGLNKIAGVTIQGITSPEQFAHRVPTVSFTHANISTHVIAEALAAENIYCWSGHNYAYEAALLLGLDENEGVVRLGIAHYNTQAEIEQALSAIEKIITSYAH